jgi:Outer membrane protein
VLTLQTQVEQTRASIPSLRNKLDQTNHLLAVLAGQAPGEAQVPQFTLADFSLPGELPVVIPSELVRQRPDIQASEALLHVASAQYGVAIANGYPQINLSANLGSQALAASNLFSAGTMIVGIGRTTGAAVIQCRPQGWREIRRGGIRCGSSQLPSDRIAGVTQCRRRIARAG